MDLKKRIEVTQRPDGRVVGYQNWSDLLFVHWRLPSEVLRPLIPEQLEIDTFDGSAWVGLVPFYMSKVRPAGFPAVPWISNFCETNLRTYVHLEGEKPGVWFFSLDAARLIPVWIARAKWNLNYFWSRMNLQNENGHISYKSERMSRRESAKVDIEATIGDEIPQSDGYEYSLEFFLAERYLLYAKSQQGLFRGQVSHRPYPLQHATIGKIHETVTARSGITVNQSPDHVAYSKGVNVEIFGLEKPGSVEQIAKRQNGCERRGASRRSSKD